jgi:gliding motility-associated-like protein
LATLRTYLTWAFSLIAAWSQAQFAPAPRCISLDQNDDVTLFWEQPADTAADFNAILISYAPGTSTNFSIVAQVTDFNQTSVLVNGDYDSPGAFIIQQVYNGFADTSAAKDTAYPIVVGLSSLGKEVSIGWNPSGLPSSDSIFRLQKEIGGTFIPYRNLELPLTAAQDTIGSCQEEVAYRVEIAGIGGCISRSNVARQVIIDDLPPEQTNLYYASVDTATGHVDLAWQASRSEDAFGYIISYFEDFVRSDTVFGAGNTNYTYTDFGVNALLQPETLSVAPFDSCFDSLNGWYNQAADSLRFYTLFVDTTDYDRCGGKLTIFWNAPDSNFKAGVRSLTGYRVYRKVRGEGSQLMATLGPDDTSFIDSTIVQGFDYTYVVSPFDDDNGFDALSNKVEVKLGAKNIPDVLYIKSIQNDHGTGENVVKLLTDTTSEAKSYGLFRSLRPDQGFVEVFRTDDGIANEMDLIDEEGAADQSAFYYQVAAYDLCKDELARSQVAKSLYIEGEKNVRDLINRVYWYDYQGFDTAGTEVDAYDLIRLTSNSEEELLFSGLGLFEYEDDIVDLRWIDGEVCYYVEAAETPGNLYGLNESSRSNLLCLSFPPRVFIPNAFTPDNDGRNDVFLPNVNYIDPSKYELLIYDRMGNLVFSTNDPQLGWDGGDLPGAVYAYSLSLQNTRDEALTFTGRVHMIR